MEREDLVREIEKFGFKHQESIFEGSQHYRKGKWNIRIDKPDNMTPYNHLHIDKGTGRKRIPHDAKLNPVKVKDPAGHIRIK
ncbi:MAG: hypothetical protein MJZ23_05275 [Paludibacteraceae bacterium]|nr:hypothetical protein [Paludibacteraceae bacterium]